MTDFIQERFYERRVKNYLRKLEKSKYEKKSEIFKRAFSGFLTFLKKKCEKCDLPFINFTGLQNGFCGNCGLEFNHV